MDKCKHCQEELDEGCTLCPHCGKDNGPEPVSEETSQAEEAVAEAVTQPCGEASEATEKVSEETDEVTEAEASEDVGVASEEEASEDADEPSEEEASEDADEPSEEEASEDADEPSEEEASEDTDEPSEAGESSPEEEGAEIHEGMQLSPAKLAIAIAAVVVLAAVLVALVLSGLNSKKTTATETTAATEPTVVATVPADGNPDDATCKGSYTVTDEEAKAANETIVATIGDQSLTNGQLQVYYWNMVSSYLNSDYGYALMMYGLLDYTQPLDTQICLEDESLTWQQFFLAKALDYWQLHQSLANEALAAGLEMSQEEREYLDTLDTSLAEMAESYGMESVDELLLVNVGPGAGLEDFAHFQELYYTGKPYYVEKTDAMVPTQEELEAYFAEHEEDYAASGITKDSKYVDVRHILLTVEGGTTGEDGSTTYSDAEWDACKAKAQEVLDAWLDGEKTEDSFAALANEKSQDPGSNTNGGLYEDVYVGQMVEPFETWCFDESREYGDYGLVQTSYGYHVMYYVGSHPMWETYATNDWTSEQSSLFIEELSAANPLQVDYSAIKLGYVELG